MTTNLLILGIYYISILYTHISAKCSRFAFLMFDHAYKVTENRIFDRQFYH